MLMWHADWAQLSISLLAHFVEQVMGRPRSQHPSCSPSCRPAPSTMALILGVRSWAGPAMRYQEKTAEGCDIDEGSKFLFHFLIRPVPEKLRLASAKRVKQEHCRGAPGYRLTAVLHDVWRRGGSAAMPLPWLARPRRYTAMGEERLLFMLVSMVFASPVLIFLFAALQGVRGIRLDHSVS